MRAFYKQLKNNIFLIWGLLVLGIYLGLFFKENSLNASFWLIAFLILISLFIIFDFLIFKFLKNLKINNLSITVYKILAGLFVGIIFLINADIILNLEFSKFKYLALSTLDILKSLFITILILLAFYGAGKKTLDKLIVKNVETRHCLVSTDSESFLFSIGLGLIFFSYLFFLLAVFKIAYSWAAYIILLIIFYFCVSEIKPGLKYFLALKIKLDIDQYGNRKKISSSIIFILLVSLLTLGFIFSLANLESAGWDTFHQYLTFPKTYADNHGLIPFEFHPHWGFPQTVEMIYLMAILLGGIKIPFLINYFFFLLFLLTLWILINKLCARSAKNKNIFLFIAAIVSSIPFLIIFYSGYLKVEIIYCFYIALIFLTLHKLFNVENVKDKNKLLILLSIWCGIGFCIKYTMAFSLISLLLVIILFKKKLNLKIKEIILSGFIIVLLFSPWAIKNIIYYQNPFYPVFSGQDIFQEKLGYSCNANFKNHCKEDMFLFASNIDLKKNSQFFSNLTILFEKLFQGKIVDLNSMGPYFLIFLPFLIFYFFKIKNNYIKALYLFSGISIILWLFFASGQVWYLLPAWVAILIIISYILINYENKNFISGLKVTLIIWLFFVIFYYLIFSFYQEKMSYFREELSLKETAQKIKSLKLAGIREVQKIDNNKKTERHFYPIDNFKIADYINQKILARDKEAVIYSFLDTQGYFIKNSHKSFIPDFFGYLFYCLAEKGNVGANFKKLGVKYILYNKNSQTLCKKDTLNREKINFCLQVDKLGRFKNFLDKHAEFVNNEGDIELYKLK